MISLRALINTILNMYSRIASKKANYKKSVQDETNFNYNIGNFN